MAGFFPVSGICCNAIRYFWPTTASAMAVGDAVRLPITGYVYPATTSVPVLGVALTPATTNSTQVAVCIDPCVDYWNEANSDLALAYVGLKFMVASGGDQIAASTGTTSGQFIMTGWKFRPGATTASGIFRLADNSQFVDIGG